MADFLKKHLKGWIKKSHQEAAECFFQALSRSWAQFQTFEPGFVGLKIWFKVVVERF